MFYLRILFFLFLGVSEVLAQRVLTESVTLNWLPQSVDSKTGFTQLRLQGGLADAKGLLSWHTTRALSTYSEATVSLSNELWEPITGRLPEAEATMLTSSAQVSSKILLAAKQPQLDISIVPLRRNGQTTERLKSATLIIETRPVSLPQSFNANRSATESLLRDGAIYRFPIKADGVYKLDYNYLKTLGVSVDNIDPQTVRLLGTRGGVLPESNSIAWDDDLIELPIKIVGESDGKFNTGDYIVFYGEGPNGVKLSASSVGKSLRYEKNVYTNTNYYYIKIGGTGVAASPKRVGQAPSISESATYYTNTFTEITHYEEDKTTLLKNYNHEASGRQWFGESFRSNTNQTFQLAVPGREPNSNLLLFSGICSRNPNSASNWDFLADNQRLGSVTSATTPLGTYSNVARYDTFVNRFTLGSTGASVAIALNLIRTSSASEGWLDYVSLNYRRLCSTASAANGFIVVRDVNSIGSSTQPVVSAFQFSEPATVWNVTNLSTIGEVTPTNNEYRTKSSGELPKLVAFSEAAIKTPEAGDGAAVANQNLHALEVPNAVIITHPNFILEAYRLAEHRRTHSNMQIHVVTTTQVFNEFSSGRPDPTAIRNFCKMFYDRNTNEKFKYLLLFGDASYDYRSIEIAANKNANLVPTYQRFNGLEPLESFGTDDYFALLDNNEGFDCVGLSDIGVGRLPINTAADATNMVNKIIYYDKNPNTLRDWRLRVGLVADDEDGGYFVTGNESMASLLLQNRSEYNVVKLYADAYSQVSSSAGARYPSCTQDLLANLDRGIFAINYFGHGGYDGWAQERLFSNTNIADLKNKDGLPLFITGTCGFAPFDNPNVDNGGEKLINDKDAGAIALLSTSRPVFANTGNSVGESAMKQMFPTHNTDPGTLGDLQRRIKIDLGSFNADNRKFILLGDPTMRLAYPEQTIVTEKINNTDFTLNPTDSATISALQRVTISGYVANAAGQPDETFNGIVYPSIYDKVQLQKTLNNDANSNVITFPSQKEIIFKGRADVKNGRFSFSFVVPRDIRYNLAFSKISYYAQNNNDRDAASAFTRLKVGGTSATPVVDNQKPIVRLFLNDSTFVSGGTTTNTPKIYALLADDNGINTAGGIGHDINAILDDLQAQSFSLNDYYESSLNTSLRGSVNYQLSKLTEGKHTLYLKAWDVSGNSGEDKIEFIVSSSAANAIRHLFNYPNPFTTNTQFQFEHSLPGQNIDVQVQIFTSSGKLIKTLHHNTTPNGFRVTDIQWNGLDEYGDQLARGTYLYKVNVKSPEGQTLANSEFQKLVILK